MSMVPLMFRDWWDDWDSPSSQRHISSFRPSRLCDQNFGLGLHKDDLLSSFWQTPASVLRSGYVRPWANNNLLRQQSKSTMNLDKEKFQVILDVQQFTPNEITVKTTDKYIVVEGKHEEKPDEHGFISRHFVRRYQIPPDVNPLDISSTLSSDGVLTVTVPLKQQIQQNSERFVPITQTGPTRKETSPKIEQPNV